MSKKLSDSEKEELRAKMSEHHSQRLKNIAQSIDKTSGMKEMDIVKDPVKQKAVLLGVLILIVTVIPIAAYSATRGRPVNSIEWFVQSVVLGGALLLFRYVFRQAGIRTYTVYALVLAFVLFASATYVLIKGLLS